MLSLMRTVSERRRRFSAFLKSDLNQPLPLSPKTKIWAQIASVAFLIPAAINSQGWISSLVVTSICFAAIVLKVVWPTKYLLLAASLAAIYTTEPHTVSAIFTGLLIHVSALKLFETTTSRDAHFSLYASIFCAFTGTLSGNTEWLYLILLPQLLLGFFALTRIHHSSLRLGTLKVRTLITYLPMILGGLSVFMVLFFLFPRIGGGFLDIGLGSGREVGLSETLSPGDLSRLSENKDEVFRVTGGLARDSYWRAYVLDQYKNSQWQKSSRKPLQSTNAFSENFQNQSEPLFLEMESNPEGFIPRLEWSVIDIGSGHVNQTQTLDNSVRRYLTVEVSQTDREPEAVKNSLIDPRSLANTPRLDAWLTNLEGLTFDEQLTALAKYFQENKAYTLTPDRQGVSNLDDLFFDVTEGYCGYFAGTTALILNKLGYPARVVLGFFGGERRDTKTIFRNSDAHAWVDVYDGFEWVSIDPTAWVTQQRLDNDVTIDSRLSIDIRSRLLNEQQSQLQSLISGTAWIQVLRYRLEEMGYLFTKYIVYFDRDKQTSLMNWISHQKMWFIVALLLFIKTLFWKIYKRKPTEDRWLTQFDRVIKKFKLRRQAGQLPEQSVPAFDHALATEVSEFQRAWLMHKTGTNMANEMASSLRRMRALAVRPKPSPETPTT